MKQWLVTQFPLFGVHFQNWMVIAIVIILVSVMFSWLSYR